jgi:hypothetical protein
MAVVGALGCGGSAQNHASADAATGIDSGPFCASPLDPDAGIVTLDDVSVEAWCEAAQGRINESTCGGITAFTIGNGVDCDRQYFFDQASRKLLAIEEGCNGSLGCVYGNSDFQPSAVCSDGSATFVDFCAEAGVSNAGPDGAGSTCTSSAQCPTGYVCGYFTNDPCPYTGTCVYADFNNDPTCSPTTFCACDGTQTEACVSSTGGYALKPVPTRGRTTSCPDAG